LSYIFWKESTIQMLYSKLDVTSGMVYYQMFCKMHQTEHSSHRRRSGTSTLDFTGETNDLDSEHFFFPGAEISSEYVARSGKQIGFMWL